MSGDALDPGLQAAFAELAASGFLPLAQWPAGHSPEDYGLEIHEGRVVPVGPWDPLSTAVIRRELTPASRDWLKELAVHPVIGSTNAHLMSRAAAGSVAGCVSLAELQTSGRGRRGRSWSSPFGANLAMSLGVALNRGPAELGGVSLVVGLAVLNALEELGVGSLALKWPNDVLLGGNKLGGILIEVARHVAGRQASELVIGIGMNIHLSEAVRAALPEGVADLAAAGGSVPRSVLAGRVLSSVVAFVSGFDERGFEPFRQPFDLRHHFHGESCRILQGETTVTGTVAGVSATGGLLLDTGAGRQEFHGGEVSLRAAR